MPSKACTSSMLLHCLFKFCASLVCVEDGVPNATVSICAGALTVEMLDPLSRAIPEVKEASDIRLFLKVQLHVISDMPSIESLLVGLYLAWFVTISV